jgi:glycosyltransferase involved in cell wall biosynthesis
MAPLWVVVPAYNEAAGIEATLAALAGQAGPGSGVTVLVVDNASTDATAAVVTAFAAAHPAMDLRLVHEPEKGTGSAADTGFRHAIAAGATLLARTDADCLPAPDWAQAARRAFADGLELVAGRLLPRTDEVPLKLWERALLPAVVRAAALFGRLRPGNRGPGYLGPYMMAAGCNLAVTAELYVRAGGFPRAAIEDVHEDRELVNRVRRLSRAYGSRRDMVVRGSVRRLRAYGLVGTLAWYLDHSVRPQVVDVRSVGARDRVPR